MDNENNNRVSLASDFFKYEKSTFQEQNRDRMPERIQENSNTNQTNTNTKGIDNIIVLFLSFVAFALPFVFTPFTYEFYQTTKNTFLLLAALILLVLWMIKGRINRKLTFIKTPFDIPIILFVGLQIVSTIFSIYKQASIVGYHSRFTGGLVSTIALVLFYYFIVNNVQSKKHIKIVLGWFITSIILLALFTILKSFGVFDSLFAKLAEDSPSLTFLTGETFTPTGATNALPLVFLLALPLLLSKVSNDDEMLLNQLIAIILSFVCILAIGLSAGFTFSTFTVAIWILLIGIVVVMYVSKSPINLNLSLKFFTIAFFLVFVMLFSLNERFRSVLVDDVRFARFIEMPFETAWSVITETYGTYKVRGFLIGTGPETYAYDFTRFRPAEQNLQPNWNLNYTASSSYIFTLLTDSGILGFLTFLGLMLFVILYFTKNVFVNKSFAKSDFSALGVSILLVFVGAFMCYISIVLQFMLWIMMALLVAIYFEQKSGEREFLSLGLVVSRTKGASGKKSEVFSYLFVGIVLLFSVASGFFVLRNYLSEVDYKSSLVASFFNDIDKANDSAVGAIRKSGGKDYLHRQLAVVALQGLRTTLAETTEQNAEQNMMEVQYWEALIREELKNSVNLNPYNASNWETSAVIYKQLVELSEGKAYGNTTLEAVSRAIELNPYNPDNYIILGYIYQYNEDEDLRNRAESVFVQAYSLQPSYVLSIFALGNYLEFVEKYDDAITLYNNSISNFYSDESQINELLHERIAIVEKKKAGQTEKVSKPTTEEITREVEEGILEE